MKILVPTDFSSNADRAVEYAALLAQKSDSAMVLLHVQTPLLSSPGIRGVMADEAISGMNDSLERMKMLTKALEQTFPALKVNYLIVEGETAEVIIEKGSAEKATLVVMGTLGASGLRKTLFGSNTVQVIRNINVPVLVIPPDAEIRVPEKMVYATDYNTTEFKPLLFAANFAHALNSKLHIVHVIPDVKHELEEKTMIDAFRQEMEGKLNYPETEFTIFRSRDVGEGLLDFTQATRADLLALTTRHKGAFGSLFSKSITEEIAFQAIMPMLVFQEGSMPENAIF